MLSFLYSTSISHRTQNSQLKKEVIDSLKVATNEPDNLQIVPIHVQDWVCSTCEFISNCEFIFVFCLYFSNLKEQSKFWDLFPLRTKKAKAEKPNYGRMKSNVPLADTTSANSGLIGFSPTKYSTSYLGSESTVYSELPSHWLPWFWFNIDFSLSMIGWTEYL